MPFPPLTIDDFDTSCQWLHVMLRHACVILRREMEKKGGIGPPDEQEKEALHTRVPPEKHEKKNTLRSTASQGYTNRVNQLGQEEKREMMTLTDAVQIVPAGKWGQRMHIICQKCFWPWYYTGKATPKQCPQCGYNDPLSPLARARTEEPASEPCTNGGPTYS